MAGFANRNFNFWVNVGGGWSVVLGGVWVGEWCVVGCGGWVGGWVGGRVGCGRSVGYVGGWVGSDSPYPKVKCWGTNRTAL
jgi:hypothetical protein